MTSNPNASPARIPLGVFGSPDEIARVVLLLAESDYITGQTMSVNGGWLVHDLSLLLYNIYSRQGLALAQFWRHSTCPFTNTSATPATSGLKKS
jgi:Enoyl-(Acyl carrier protein) reductase